MYYPIWGHIDFLVVRCNSKSGLILLSITLLNTCWVCWGARCHGYHDLLCYPFTWSLAVFVAVCSMICFNHCTTDCSQSFAVNLSLPWSFAVVWVGGWLFESPAHWLRNTTRCRDCCSNRNTRERLKHCYVDLNSSVYNSFEVRCPLSKFCPQYSK